jgi:hypothetical protein
MSEDSREGPPDRGDDLEDTAAELARVLSDLRAELERERERRGSPTPPRGPLGIPRPPSPREVLRFADEVAIPAALAILEANVRLLEALQRGIRMAETGRDVQEGGERAADRATAAGRETLSRLEGALADLQRAVEGDDLPENETARDLLEDARRLRDEVAAELDDRAPDRSAGAWSDGPQETAGEAVGSEENAVDVDVEGELETLKDRYGEDDERDPTGNGGDSEDEGDAGTA